MQNTIAPRRSICNLQFALTNLQWLLCVLLLAGCQKPTQTDQQTAATEEAISGQYREELLAYAVDNLGRLEEFTSPDVLRNIIERLNPNNQPKPGDFNPLLSGWPQPEMLYQVVDRLNQWARTQPPPSGWQRDPMLATLPEPFLELPQLQDLDSMEFSRFDGYALEEAVWLREISRWAKGEVIDDLERAKNLFDWTVRNIALEPDGPRSIPRLPWETLLFGRGTATERAWVYVLLLRQLDIDAAVLAVEAKGDGKDHEKYLRPWCVGVLIDGNVYLFDPLLGLPIPRPDGVKVDPNGQLNIEPATLEQVIADERLLREMDAGEKELYRIRPGSLKGVTAQLEASPPYLARRMKLLESQLIGPKKMVLTTQPTAKAEHWKSLKHIDDVSLWSRPYQTLYIRSHLSWQAVQAMLSTMLPFYMVYDERDISQQQSQQPKIVIHAGALGRARVLQLKGQFSGEDGATRFYQIARPSEQSLKLSSADRIEKGLYRMGKQDASYWSGLIAFERGNYESAIDYFWNRTLRPFPTGTWTNGAKYNLARSYEAAGETSRAILQYGSNDASPGYPGDLLRARWLREKVEKRKAEDKPKS